MEERIRKIKEDAKKILKSYSIDVLSTDYRSLEYLKNIENRIIKEDEIEIIERIINNTEMYYHSQSKMILAKDDYSYLKEIAANLRNQSVRLEDGVTFGDPIFKISKDRNEEFITREGAKKFREVNSTTIKYEELNEKDSQERRKNNVNVIPGYQGKADIIRHDFTIS